MNITESVTAPPHYTNGRAYNPINVAEDWRLSPNLTNVLKYISRHEQKGGHEDLEKALWYLTRELTLRYTAPNDVLSIIVESSHSTASAYLRDREGINV